jgi:membrane fusion protein, multidrug efflux system
MKLAIQFTFLAALALIITACGGGGKKEKNQTLAGKKEELAKLKKQREDLNGSIRKLETDIAALDSNAGMRARAKLVSLMPVAGGDFEHFIELQGKVDAENISYISPRGLPGQVKAIYIKKGDFVRKGQLVLKLDDAVIQQSMKAARSQLDVLKSNLGLAKTVYERQKNLWDQNIGSELQLLQAKNNVENLENQMKSVDESVKTLWQQAQTNNVYSDVSGVVDEVNVKLGETFQGFSVAGPQIKVINTSELKVVVNIPENYIGRVGSGTKVRISVPDINKTVDGVISFASQSVDPNQRGFIAEIKIGADSRLKPNQLALVKVLDYSASGAITVPVNIVQTDDKGKYVFVAETSSNGNMYAKKRPVITGQFYGEFIEVKSGLQGGDRVVSEGYQNIYDGQMIKTDSK